MNKPNGHQMRFNLRRHSDLSRLIIVYCVVGLILGFAQIALSAEEKCYSTYSEIQNSNSPVLKNAVATLRGRNLTNLSNSTHLKFPDGDRIQIEVYSTTGSRNTDLEFHEGAVSVCESGGEIKIKSVLADPPPVVVFEESCFRVVGALARLAGDRVKFCPGQMPSQVQAALLRDRQSPAVIAQSHSRPVLQ